MISSEDEERFMRAANAYPPDDRALLKSVFRKRRSVHGMLEAKALWIIDCVLTGQPKIGWREDAQAIVEAVR